MVSLQTAVDVYTNNCTDRDLTWMPDQHTDEPPDVSGDIQRNI